MSALSAYRRSAFGGARVLGGYAAGAAIALTSTIQQTPIRPGSSSRKRGSDNERGAGPWPPNC
jgi:hypothetical protein